MKKPLPIETSRPVRLKAAPGGCLRRAGMLASTLMSFAVCLLVGHAQSTNVVSRLDYEAFKVITQRNIFDPNRSSRSGRPTDSPRPARVESFALTGTLSYEKGTYAFFDGSSASYRKALQIGDSIAGNKVAEITTDHVKLEANGQQIELSVGMQMKKLDEGDWQVGGRAESSSAAAPATASNDKAENSSGGEDGDVLKKLLQKREQELK